MERLVMALGEGHPDVAKVEAAMRLWGWFAGYFAVEKQWQVRMVSDAMINGGVDAVVVLSGGMDEESQKRIAFGLPIAGWDFPLLVNGATEQLDKMYHMAVESFAGGLQIGKIDAGPTGVANTATQFDAMRDCDLERILVVTSGYHVPRVILTAAKRLPRTKCFIVGVPYADDWGYNVANLCAAEIARILEYSAKGDIADPSVLWSEA